MTDNFAIQTKNISKRYKLYPSHTKMALDWCGFYRLRFWKKRPTFPYKNALTNINLRIEKGQRYGLIGKNGAGKTTLLKTLGGMIAPSSGTFVTNGDLQSMMRIGGGFHPDFTGRQNVRFSLLYKGLKGKDLNAAIDDVIDFAELGDFIDQPLKNYSLGMASRLQFAAATAVKPDILLIDEVLGAGDAYFAEKSMERMKKLTNSGCTLILVSHSKTQILEFCNKGIWLDNGTVRMEGDVDIVMAAYETEMVREINHSSLNDKQNDHYIIPPSEKLATIFKPEKIMDAYEMLVWKKPSIQNVLFTGETKSSSLNLLSMKTYVQSNNRNDCNTGDDIAFEFSLEGREAEEITEMTVLCHDDGGHLVATDNVKMQSVKNLDITNFSYNLTPLCMGYGDYLFSFIFKKSNLVIYALGGIYVKVNETNDSNPPLLHYMGKWYQNGDEEPEFSRISGVQ